MSSRPPVAPYLTVSPAAGAVAFYTAAFDAKQKALMPALDGMRIMHCELEINGGSVFLSDAFLEFGKARSPLPGEPVTMSVTPVLAPMPRGILATCTAKAKPGIGVADVTAAFAVYETEPFVHLLGEGEWPQTGATLGSNSTHLQVAFDQHAGRIVVVSALDNLTKGAAGQAIQNANIALGLDELSGLPTIGVAP